jgi:fructose-1,6-bisphosphatase/inositol monophosphatase family enzyme
MLDKAKIEQIVILANEEYVLNRFGKLRDKDIACKSKYPHDVVTIADKEAEEFIKARIWEIDPNALFIGEESSFKNPQELFLMEQDEPVWIIDPIDGTANFKNGVAKFGTILSCVQKKEIIYGCIYNPITKTLISAEKGSGAWCQGKRLSINTSVSFEDSLAILSLQFFEKEMAEKIAERAFQFLRWQSNFGSVAIDYQSCALSDVQIAVFNFIRVWDHAAGVLIHQEAGGYAAKFDGTPYCPLDIEGGIILAPDQDIWNYFYSHVMGDM